MLDRALRAPFEKHQRAEGKRRSTVAPEQMKIDRQSHRCRTSQEPWYQQTRFVELRPEFLWIENVEEDDFVSMVTQRFDGADNVLRRREEIGNDHDHAALAQEVLEVEQRLGVVGTRARLRIFEAAQQTIKLALASGSTDINAHFLVKNDQARGVALGLRREVKK